MAAAGPIRDGKRLFSVAPLGHAAAGVLVLHEPDGTAEEAERVTIEHATTVLAMEFARLQTLAEAEARLRSDLVVELVEGVEGAQALSHALPLGYDLGRPHRVIVVEGCHGDDQADDFLHAVRRAAQEARIGSLVAAGPGEVVIWRTRRRPGRNSRAALAAGVAPC
jgi:sugar diacid utilization regulator